jgi:hypothetical protein
MLRALQPIGGFHFSEDERQDECHQNAFGTSVGAAQPA